MKLTVVYEWCGCVVGGGVVLVGVVVVCSCLVLMFVVGLSFWVCSCVGILW